MPVSISAKYLVQWLETMYNIWHIVNLVYSEPCLFRRIEAYSGIFSNSSYNYINFLFFTLILHTFQRNLKRYMFFHYNISAWLSLRKCIAIFENSFLIQQLKWTFFSENMFYIRKESSVTKFCCIRSKFLMFPCKGISY